MIERLLENWLDSASERSYQPVFVQMLAAEGYTVLHSTRHCLLEFGKDILAIAPDGVGCAFQLKGDPGGRMTVGRFRAEVQDQLLQLISQQPAYPGFPPGTHRSFLVSNGQFEEEVQTAVAQMNARPLLSKIDLWSRGNLLELCKKHGHSLWPGELTDNRALLELYLAHPRAQLPRTILSGVLESVLHLRIGDERLNRSELARAATSAAWLTGISTAAFADAENHQAVAHAWTICCVSLVAAESRHGQSEVKALRTALALAEAALLDALTALWNEVQEQQSLVQGNPMTDSVIHGWRVSVIYGMLACLALACMRRDLLQADSRDALATWLTAGKHRLLLWGEGAVAHAVPWLVWLRTADASRRVDAEIDLLARSVVALNQSGSTHALANPYYDYEQIVRHHVRHPEVARTSGLDRETSDGSSFTAEAVLHLLVRANLKNSCRVVWPAFSRLTHRRFVMDEPWHYGLQRAPGGIEESRIFPETYSWAQLKIDALRGDGEIKLPEYLAENPWLLAMWWQASPHRFDKDSLRAFVEAAIPGWGT